jgi:hypothetical protein
MNFMVVDTNGSRLSLCSCIRHNAQRTHLDINTPLHHISIGLIKVNLRSTHVKGTFELLKASLQAIEIEPILVIVNHVAIEMTFDCPKNSNVKILIVITNLVATHF